MARTEADLSHFMFASDYDPVHYKWTEKELEALEDCKATAEVIKIRLEDNGAKVKEMYVIEHRSEAKAAKEFHSNVDEAQRHYHIVVSFEPSHGATLREIAEYIGFPPEVIEKPKPGRYSYNNMLSYLTHIKYEDKIQYPPEDVVTLVGTDYMDYYNANKERWIKARSIVAKKGGKPLNQLFREAMVKLETGEITYEELCGIEKYDKLRLEPKYRKKLNEKKGCISEKAKEDLMALKGKIENNEITSLAEIAASRKWRLAYLYERENITKHFVKRSYDNILNRIKSRKTTSLSEIKESEYWVLFSEHEKELIGKEFARVAHDALLVKLNKEGITSFDEIMSDEYWKSGYEYNKYPIEFWCSQNNINIRDDAGR